MNCLQPVFESLVTKLLANAVEWKPIEQGGIDSDFAQKLIRAVVMWGYEALWKLCSFHVIISERRLLGRDASIW
jgi:hypothetical protein